MIRRLSGRYVRFHHETEQCVHEISSIMVALDCWSQITAVWWNPGQLLSENALENKGRQHFGVSMNGILELYITVLQQMPSMTVPVTMEIKYSQDYFSIVCGLF